MCLKCAESEWDYELRSMIQSPLTDPTLHGGRPLQAIATAHLVSSRCYPVELGGRVSVCPALQCNWLPGTDVNGRWEGIRRDLRETAVCSTIATSGVSPSSCHHLPQLSTHQLMRRGTEGGGGLQDL